MKNLIFNIKRNLKKSPKIYVISPDKKITYGSFSASNPDEFDGWDVLSTIQTIELKQYMSNMRSLMSHFDDAALNEQTDFRLKLPIRFIQCINEINDLALKSNVDMDIFDPMIVSIIQQLKIVTTKLPPEEKKIALSSLDKLGLSEYKKIDYSNQIRSIFSELLTIHNKSEKLQTIANELFNKDKGISPKSIDAIAKGELSTSRWLVACAIEIMLQERPSILFSTLSIDDLFMLWAKQLLDHGLDYEALQAKAMTFNLPGLTKKIEAYYNQHYWDKKQN